MNTLFLGKPHSPIRWMFNRQTEDAIDSEYIDKYEISFIVSYRYRHIVSKKVLRKLPGRIVNLHISCLPYCRGADPHFWSIWEDVPRGVTLHLMDKGIDSGPIISQKEIKPDYEMSLHDWWTLLNNEAVEMFIGLWGFVLKDVALRSGVGVQDFLRTKEQGNGSTFSLKDRKMEDVRMFFERDPDKIKLKEIRGHCLKEVSC